MKQAHIMLEENLGVKYALMPGDPGRIRRIAEHLSNVQQLENNREFLSIRGSYKGVDILVVNALRKEQHLSHFTLSEALHLSYLVSPRLTYLTHISHQMGRQAQEEPALPENCYMAYDGLKIETRD